MERQTLFACGDGGYSAFRIPTILTLSSGRVLVFCEGRRDGLGDSGRIDIMMRAGDGDRFGDMRVVVSGNGDTVGNPCSRCRTARPAACSSSTTKTTRTSPKR